MHILSENIKKKSDTNIINLEYRNLGNNTLIKNYLKKGKLRHNPSPIKEWYNSIYNLEKNNYTKTLPIKDKLIYKLFDTYFNLDKIKKYDNLSMGKIFVGKPEVKHFNNKIYITLYIFNKWIMRYHKMINIMKLVKIIFSQNNKQFIMLKNKPFLTGALLFKYPKYDQKLIVLIKTFLIKIFNNNNNDKKIFIETLYNNIITFFDKTELYKILNLRKDIDLYGKKSFINNYKFNVRAEKCIYIYLYIINYFFNYIGFSKMINILKKVFLCSSKENRTNTLKITLEKLRKIYFSKLKINSLYIYLGLINLFLMFKKLLKNIYIIKLLKKNIYFNRYKFNIKNILILKNNLSKLYNNNRIEINIINLKYLHLDGNVLVLAVARKLKNRNRRVLRVIRMALRLSKKPYINEYYSNKLDINNLDTLFIKKNLDVLINDNIALNKDLISKPMLYKSRIIFYYLKHKIISGMKLQGTGRLTKRLTASRSISKYMSKGSLKNRASSHNGLSTIVLRGYVKSNLQYVNINYYNRIGTYGIKSWISNQ